MERGSGGWSWFVVVVWTSARSVAAELVDADAGAAAHVEDEVGTCVEETAACGGYC